MITENQLDEWVRGNALDAQRVIVELIWRLVSAASPRPRERRFPLGDSIGQHGPDGVLQVDLGLEPFVPDGRSIWEIGTGLDAHAKATSDYRDSVVNTPPEVRAQSTFIFVTPLSGRRDWDYTWKPESQADWLGERRARNDWKDVRIIDGTRLVDWLHQFTPVWVWFAERALSLPTQHIETLEHRWSLLRSIGEPPGLLPGVFLCNRNDAADRLKTVIDGTTVQLKLSTHFPDDVVDFSSAYVASLGDEQRADANGRCLIISSAEAWNSIAAQRESHILIADPALDLAGEAGVKLIQKARRSGHSVIYGGAAGGIPDPTCVPLATARQYELKQALEASGYGEERARTLALKCAGNLGSLLRCIQNLSVLPEWADGSGAGDLVIAAILGSWVESSEADRMVVERVSGKDFGEWIGMMRAVMLQPGTPLRQTEGVWRFVARYEGWYALGPRLFDEHLDRLKAVAVAALQEPDPQFDLPSDDRYMAQVLGKALNHSSPLRRGLAEALALAGSHPGALSSCSRGKPEAAAILSVRELLSNADWRRWAGLNDLLPLLAEASPNEFLNCVESALRTVPSPFDEVFAQEGEGFVGRNYMTGLLWALETLAWDPDCIGRAILCLGELASHDPGGRWANRPLNSITTIVLPWLPQTVASIDKRRAALTALLNEQFDAGWKVLLSLLPNSLSASSGSRRPEWRKTIPDDWSQGVTQREYWQQVNSYAGLLVDAARRRRDRLVSLIEKIDALPPSPESQLIEYLTSDEVTQMPQDEKLAVWMALREVIGRHTKFSNADWAMRPDRLNALSSVAERLAPSSPELLHRRLFSDRDFDLYDEEKGSYEAQQAALDERRAKAVREILDRGGVESVLAFASTVQSPLRVGVSLGAIGNEESDRSILPHSLFMASRAALSTGYVRSKFFARGWQWVDGLDLSAWTPEEIAGFLAILPFTSEAWRRVEHLLPGSEAMYWAKTGANAHECGGNLDQAADLLVKFGRPLAALECLYRMKFRGGSLDIQRTVTALLAGLSTKEVLHSNDGHTLLEMLGALQGDPQTNAADLFRLEWGYLDLLRHGHGTTPKTLERKLADDPNFFCEVIRLIYGPEDEKPLDDDATERRRRLVSNAYYLLSQWRVPPGSESRGTFSGEALNRWVDAVRGICAEGRLLQMANSTLGHVLFYSPPDPSGLWIHSAAATTLNSREAVDVRGGFSTEVFNSRGAHYVDPTGKPERDLAAKYRADAEAVELAGYHRLADVLRGVANSYEQQAERIVADERFGGGG